MFFLVGLGDTVLNAINGAWRSFMLFICQFIYRSITYVYDIFARLACAEILSDTTIMAIYQRVGLVLGIFMVFKLSFSFIQIVINPDSIGDSQKGAGSIVLKAILVVVLLGVVPYIFTAAYEIQRAVIEDGIINRIILGTKVSQEEIDPGVDLAYNIFTGTYDITDDADAINATDFSDDDSVPKYINGEKLDSTYVGCHAVVNEFNGITPRLKWEMQNFGTMDYASACVNVMYASSSDGDKFLMNFDPLYCLIIGIFVLYILVIYCIKAAERIIQLAFLQLIAPVPIMSYLSPKKDGLFDKWVKMCITTFLDIFIRTAVISLTAALALIVLKDDTGNVLYNTTNQPEGFKWFLIQALVIIGLFFFAKRVPELLKELFPSAGAASLGSLFQSPKSFMKDMKESPVGAIGRGAVGAVKAPFKAGRKIRDIHDEGGTVRGAMAAGVRQRLGMRTAADKQDKDLKHKQAAVDYFDAAKKEAQSEVDKNENKYINATGQSLGTLRQLANDQRISAEQRARHSEDYNKLRKQATEHAMAHGGSLVDGATVAFDANGIASDVRPDQIDRNATISANMEASARITKTDVNDFGAVKDAAKAYSNEVVTTKTSDSYQRNVANRDNSIGGGKSGKK